VLLVSSLAILSFALDPFGVFIASGPGVWFPAEDSIGCMERRKGTEKDRRVKEKENKCLLSEALWLK